MTMEEQQVLLRAIKKYGGEPQMRMAMEECAELIVALSHHLRARCQIADVISEIADVEIMIEQLKLIFDAFDEVGRERTRKVERLRMKLDA